MDCCKNKRLNREGTGCTDVGETYGVYQCTSCGVRWKCYAQRPAEAAWEMCKPADTYKMPPLPVRTYDHWEV